MCVMHAISLKYLLNIIIFIIELMLDANVNQARELKEKCFLYPQQKIIMIRACGGQRCNSDNFRR